MADLYSRSDFNDLLNLLEDAAWNPDAWSSFLQKFAQITRGSCTTLYLTDGKLDKESLCVSVHLPVDDQKTYYTPFRHKSVHNKDVFADSPTLSNFAAGRGQNAFEGEFHDDWLLAGIIIREHSIKANIVSLRPRHEPAFSSEHVSFLKELMPYLRRAVLLHIRVRAMEMKQMATSKLLDHFTMGIILVDCKGRIVSVNRKAQETLKLKDGLWIADEEIRTFRSRETELLRKAIYETAPCRSNHTAGTALRISRASLREPLSVLVTTFNDQASHNPDDQCNVAVFIHDPEERFRAAEDRMQQLYELTPTEARLASALIKGYSLEQAAEQMEISISTARTHIKRVLSKTNTNRQGQLILLLMSNPAIVGR